MIRPAKRMLEALELYASGMPAKRVAEEMGLAERTAEQYIYIAKRKLQLRNMADIVRWHLKRHGWNDCSQCPHRETSCVSRVPSHVGRLLN